MALIEDEDEPGCCDKPPVLDTWDHNELRSIYCPVCGRRTTSYWERRVAYDEWRSMIQTAKERDVNSRRSFSATTPTTVQIDGMAFVKMEKGEMRDTLTFLSHGAEVTLVVESGEEFLEHNYSQQKDTQ